MSRVRWEAWRRSPRVQRTFTVMLLIVAALLMPRQSVATPPSGNKTRQVLVLNAYTPTYAWTANIVAGVQSVFGKMDNVELSVDFMDTKKIYTPEYAQLLADVYAKKYAKLHFDLIISSDDDALDFLLKYRDTVFPNVPVVFAGVNNYRDGRLGGHRGFTGVNEENDYDKSFDWIAKNRPQTKQILVVTDDTATSLSHIKRINSIRKNWDKRFAIRFTDKVSVAELQKQLRELPPDAAVFWAMFMRDRSNFPLSFGQSVKLVVEASPVPVFGFMDITVSQGAVGGYVASGFAQGQTAARLGERILTGENVDAVPIVRQSPNVYMSDYPSMQRWRIPDEALPADSVVLNRPVSFYQEYKQYVWAALGGMGAETLVIFALIGVIRTLTSKHRKRLRESEDRYRSIVEDGSELICRLAPKGTVRFANGALSRLIGRQAESLVGKPFADALSSDVAVLSPLKAISKTNPVVPLELECLGVDGQKRWVLWHCRGIIGENGTVNEIQAVGHDITERRRAESALKDANTDLQGVLDGMREALVVCDRQGRIGKIHSRAAVEWFGEPEEGMRLVDYLFDADGHAKSVFELALTQICEDLLPFEMNVAQFPELVRRGERAFRVDCQQIFRNNEFTETIFTLTDVTAKLHQERVERMNRELPAIVGNLLRDREGFQSFVQDVEDLLARLASSESRSEQRRILHTLKGNTAIYGFEHIANRCHILEDAIDLDASEPSESSILTLTNQWEESLDSFSMFLNHDTSEGIELNPKEYEDVLQRLEQGQDHSALLRSVRRWAHPRMEQVLGIYARTVRQLAQRFNKEIEVVIEDNGLRLPRGEMRWFLSVLVHVIRNAVDHGIEAPEQREATQKPRSGRVTIESAIDGPTFVVRVSDDGRGIDWGHVKRRAMELGLPHETPRDLEVALFHDGLTTKETVNDISGRGVGLGAVLDSCRELGGSVTVKSELGAGTRFEFRFILPSFVPAPIRGQSKAPFPISATVSKAPVSKGSASKAG